MSKANQTEPQEPFPLTKEEVRQVANSLEKMYHSVISMHDLSCRAIQEMGEDADDDLIIAIREMARSCARELQSSVEKLTGDQLGYFEAKFGSL